MMSVVAVFGSIIRKMMFEPLRHKAQLVSAATPLPYCPTKAIVALTALNRNHPSTVNWPLPNAQSVLSGTSSQSPAPSSTAEPVPNLNCAVLICALPFAVTVRVRTSPPA